MRGERRSRLDVQWASQNMTGSGLMEHRRQRHHLTRRSRPAGREAGRAGPGPFGTAKFGSASPICAGGSDFAQIRFVWGAKGAPAPCGALAVHGPREAASPPVGPSARRPAGVCWSSCRPPQPHLLLPPAKLVVAFPLLRPRLLFGVAAGAAGPPSPAVLEAHPCLCHFAATAGPCVPRRVLPGQEGASRRPPSGHRVHSSEPPPPP